MWLLKIQDLWFNQDQLQKKKQKWSRSNKKKGKRKISLKTYLMTHRVGLSSKRILNLRAKIKNLCTKMKIKKFGVIHKLTFSEPLKFDLSFEEPITWLLSLLYFELKYLMQVSQMPLQNLSLKWYFFSLQLLILNELEHDVYELSK